MGAFAAAAAVGDTVGGRISGRGGKGEIEARGSIGDVEDVGDMVDVGDMGAITGIRASVSDESVFLRQRVRQPFSARA